MRISSFDVLLLSVNFQLILKTRDPDMKLAEDIEATSKTHPARRTTVMIKLGDRGNLRLLEAFKTFYLPS